MLALIAAIALTWTAPGDDGNVGTATVYDLRYASDSATVAGWTTATQATGEPAPRPAGTTETQLLTLPPGKYWFAIRARDEAGNQAPLSNVISKSEGDTVSSVVISSDDFESGYGSFTDGGADCMRHSGTTYSHQGVRSIDLQSNTSASLFTTTTGRNVSTYASMEVDFWFKMVSLESGEDFWLQYSANGGTTWQTVAAFVRAVGQYDNNTFYHMVVNLPKTTYAYTSNAKLRFRCDASGIYDDVYIDEVIWRGKTGSLQSAQEDPPALTLEKDVVRPDSFGLEQNYPNPFNPTTSLAFLLGEECQVRIDVYNVLGRQVATLADDRYPAGRHVVQWNARGAASGAYFYRMQAGSHIQTRSMMLLK